jgi:hypothetical protein
VIRASNECDLGLRFTDVMHRENSIAQHKNMGDIAKIYGNRGECQDFFDRLHLPQGYLDIFPVKICLILLIFMN